MRRTDLKRNKGQSGGTKKRQAPLIHLLTSNNNSINKTTKTTGFTTTSILNMIDLTKIGPNSQIFMETLPLQILRMLNHSKNEHVNLAVTW
jgi:hypothetical protein